MKKQGAKTLDETDADFEPEDSYPNPEEEEIEVERNLLEKKISEQFSAEFVKILRRISYYISKVGLGLKEACQLVSIEYDDFIHKMKEHPIIQELIARKELEFKADLLTTVSLKARSGNDKLATWLLSTKFSDEFNTKKGSASSPSSDSNDLIAMGIEFIQKNGDNNPLVAERSGRAFVVKKGGGENLLARIGKMLN